MNNTDYVGKTFFHNAKTGEWEEIKGAIAYPCKLKYDDIKLNHSYLSDADCELSIDVSVYDVPKYSRVRKGNRYLLYKCGYKNRFEEFISKLLGDSK